MDENTLSTSDTSYNFLCNGKEILMRKSIVTAERLGCYFKVSVNKLLFQLFIFVRLTYSYKLYK